MAESYYKAARNNMKNRGIDSLSVEVNIFPAAVKKGNEVINIMASNCEEELKYYFTLAPKFRATIQEDLQRSFYIMRELSNISGHYGEKELSANISKRLNDLLKVYQPELAEPEVKK
jgi:hypothetical protein